VSELFLVRHAQASFGQDDYDKLSDLGHRQSEWLGEYFAARNIVFDQVVTGAMTRHRETLTGISRGMQQATNGAHQHAAWNEFDFETLTKLYMQQNPEARPAADADRRELYGVLKKSMLAWAEDTIDRAGTTMESWSDFRSRVTAALHQIQTDGADRKVLIVSSGGSISAALQHVLDLPAASMVQLNLQTRNTGLHRCVFNTHSISLASFNNTPHLDTRERQQYITYT
jgi:broad specificity phosphatase PhoE